MNVVTESVGLWNAKMAPVDLHGARLRFPVPAAICSSCLGETKIGAEFQKGNVKVMKFQEIPWTGTNS